MKREVITTRDGSNSISIPELNVTYHSIHGALLESKHVYIDAGLLPILHQYETIYIFEMGFGTGLNALLSLQTATTRQQKIHYTAIELFPLTIEEASLLNYADEGFMQLHTCDWEKDIEINPYFTLHKTNASIIDSSTDKPINLLYFDAFAAAAQPELWTKEIFEKLFAMLDTNAVLVTYSSKGSVRRAMLEAGFSVEKIPGALHKREMIRARKITVPKDSRLNFFS